jgi:5'-3' exonuclease
MCLAKASHHTGRNMGLRAEANRFRRRMAKWLLVDGYNMAFRAFYGMPELTRADGFPTGALHGWVKTLWKL